MATIQSQGLENRKARAENARLLRTPRDAEADMSTVFDAQRLYGNRALAGAAMFGPPANPASVVQRARLVVQPRLTLGPVDDTYEREADSVAERVVQRLAAPQALGDAARPVQRQAEEEEELQMKPAGAVVQREGMEEEEEELQAKHVGGPGPTALDPGLESQIQRARTGGSALEPATRSSMEGAIGSDFGGVRVHTGQESDALNRNLSARAFTTGSDIFFRSGEYNPGTVQGQQLLAHELTHVVQQGAAGVRTRRIDSGVQRKRAPQELFFGASFA